MHPSGSAGPGYARVADAVCVEQEVVGAWGGAGESAAWCESGGPVGLAG